MNIYYLAKWTCNSRGSGRSTSEQMPRGNAQLLLRGVGGWFKMGRVMLKLAVVLMAAMLVSPALHAGIIFSAGGTQSVGPGGSVSVPITVSYDAGTSGNWINAGFHVTWDNSVLNLQSTTPLSVSVAGSPLNPLDLGNFSNPAVGELDFTWFNGVGVPVTGGSTLFTVNFTAIGSFPSSTSVSFSTPDTMQLYDSLGHDLGTFDPTAQNGRINVVPEPVNWALGLFACVFIGGAGVRWASQRRSTLASVRTASELKQQA